ncbi:hypothetical protein ABTX35_35600, partial [Streptomyces sp. NPDC096080]
MQSQDVAPRPAPASAEPAVDVEQAEAALVEHYPRLVRLAYLVLPPSLGRNRRVVTAHALTQRALPRGRSTAPLIPAQATGRDGDPGYGADLGHAVGHPRRRRRRPAGVLLQPHRCHPRP